MKKDDIRLRGVIVVTETFKTTAQFWKEVKEGDEVEIITTVEANGEYAQSYSLTNLNSGDKHGTSGGILANQLRRLKYEFRPT